MKTKRSSTARSRKTRETVPSPAQISRQRVEIQSGWSMREKQRRRVDSKHPAADARLQAHVRFLQFLIELETQNR